MASSRDQVEKSPNWLGKVVIGLVVFAVAVLLLRVFLHGSPLGAEIEERAQLDAVARQFNAQGTHTVSPGLRFDKATVGPGLKLTMAYTFPNLKSANLDKAAIEKPIKDFVKSMCEIEDVRLEVNRGAAVVFTFNDADNVEIIHVDLTKAVCAG
jgi:hypothetical protein